MNAKNFLIMTMLVAITGCTSYSQETLSAQTQVSAQTSVLPVPATNASIDPTETPTRLFRPLSGFPGIVTGQDREGENIRVVANNTCILLEQAYFWRPGDHWDTFEDLPLVTIELNDQPIQNLFRSMGGLLEIEYDPHGQEIGYHGFSFDFCFMLDRQPEVKATNTISVNVVTKSGEAYPFTWDFMYDPQLISSDMG